MAKDNHTKIINLNESNLYFFGEDKEKNPEILSVIIPVETINKRFNFKIEKIDLLNRVNNYIFERDSKIEYSEVNRWFNVTSNNVQLMNSILGNRRLRKLLIKSLFNHKKIIIEYNCNDSLRPSDLSVKSCLGIYIDNKTLKNKSHVGLLKMVSALFVTELENNNIIRINNIVDDNSHEQLIRDKKAKVSVDTISMFNS